jgi:secernin
LPAIVSQAGLAGKQITPPAQAAADAFAPTSYWWLFRQLIDSVKGDPIAARPGYYQQRNQLVRARFDQLEQEFAAEVPEVWRQYVRAGDAHILDRFAERCVERVVTALQETLNALNA